MGAAGGTVAARLGAGNVTLEMVLISIYTEL